MLRKCCAHCPGSVTRTGDPIREHDCSVPNYVTGNLRVSSMTQKKHVCNKNKTDKDERDDSDIEEKKVRAPSSCYERFAVAKKFHAENLQHQPLPDRVDDAIFTHSRPADDSCMCDAVKRCQKIKPKRPTFKKDQSRAHKYGPELGCKKPLTYMDLAICWETPIDQNYEPRRAAHIDGSDGGPAPAVFTLVQHADSQIDVREGCIPGQQREDGFCDKCGQNRAIADEREDLCRNLDSIHITEDPQIRRNIAIGDAARAKRLQFNRSIHCLACNKVNSPRRSRAKSATFLQKHGVILKKNNGLPCMGKSNVPRPRTPYARRSFCIDTLTPPFSIVNGCRDADYPEHWRLTSIYQQSYRNPRKMREGRTLINYDRIPFV